MPTLVIRLSSLGDVVLCGAVTGGLAPVTFWTRPAYAEIAAKLPGVVAVVTARPDLNMFKKVVDLHHNARTVSATLLRRGVARVPRYDLRRRLRVAFKTRPAPRVVERYAAAAGVAVAPLPWIALPDAGPREALALVPGAAHATKRWPTERWVDLGRRWSGPVVVLGGPDEAGLVGEVAGALGAEAIAERGFDRTLEALGRSRALVAGDTGLLHLGAAAGLPVVGLYGPTTSADGFWCWPGAAVELDLSCRPCSRFGGPVCPMGDHRCLADLDVDRVWAALQGIL